MIEFVLNGTNIVSPPEWDGMGISISFENTVQGDIDVQELTFGSDSCKLIDAWIAKNGMFRGMPFDIRDNGFTFFRGYLDFNKKYEIIHKGKRVIAITKDKGLNQLSDFIDSYTFGLLNINTSLSFVNVPYVVEKKNNFLEEALLSIANLIILKEIYEQTRRLLSSINNFVSAIGNTPFNVGLLIGATVQVLIDLAYTALMIVAYKDIISDFINSLISPVRFHKSINVNDTLTKFFGLEYNGFQTGIAVLPELYYIPSKNEDTRSLGIPNSNDYGYLLKEFIDLIQKATNSKLFIDASGNIQLRSENDSYLVRNSTYVMSDILHESVKYNTNELVGTRNISFDTDVKDEWTIDNFKGTAYDIFTRSTSTNGTNLVKGLEEIRVNACLGSRKDGLNKIETALKKLGGLADKLINALGGSSNLSNKVTRRVGMLKVSNEIWDKPKLLRLDSAYKLPSVQNWNSKFLYDNYYNYKSFVLNGNGYQKRIFEEVEIPFCKEDYDKVVNNSYFVDNFGNVGKFTDLKVKINENKAVASWWINEVYDTNLIESYVEP